MHKFQYKIGELTTNRRASLNDMSIIDKNDMNIVLNDMTVINQNDMNIVINDMTVIDKNDMNRIEY
jgi:hypothetical protein